MNKLLSVRFKKMRPDVIIPKYAKEHDSGMDLRAYLGENKEIVIAPLFRAIVPTGLIMELPTGWEGQIRPRSGLAAKFGITVLNTPGTIDAGYRGEIKVILTNISENLYRICHGDRIAQLVISPIIRLHVEEVEEVNDTDRGEGGLGSTGDK